MYVCMYVCAYPFGDGQLLTMSTSDHLKIFFDFDERGDGRRVAFL